MLSIAGLLPQGSEAEHGRAVGSGDGMVPPEGVVVGHQQARELVRVARDRQEPLEAKRDLAQRRQVVSHVLGAHLVHDDRPAIRGEGDAVGEPFPVPIGPMLERRLEAIACYGSQVPVIFRFTTDFKRAIADFADARGGADGPAERFWPVRPGEWSV